MLSKNATAAPQRLTYAQNAGTPELARLSEWFSAETLINETQPYDFSRKSCYSRMTRSGTPMLASVRCPLGQ